MNYCNGSHVSENLGIDHHIADILIQFALFKK